MYICMYIYIYIYIYIYVHTYYVYMYISRVLRKELEAAIWSFLVSPLHPVNLLIVFWVVDSLRGSSVKIGTIQRRLAWPLRKDDTHKSRSVN